MSKLEKVVYFILAPFFFMAGVIYYLWTGKTELEKEIENERREDWIKATLAQKEEAKKRADEAEEKYRAALDKHKRNNGSSE